MTPTESLVRLSFLVLQGAAALGVLSTLPAGQLEREAEAATLRQVITGRVCMPDGSPAVGAEVVTSAGGKVVTGGDGSFTLTVDLSLDAETIEVTAVEDATKGSGTLVASARIMPAALAPSASTGRLALTLSPNCVPRWLPTFGGRPGTGGEIYALTVFDDGTGPALCAGGQFADAGGVSARQIARWDGTGWSALGSGVGGQFSSVFGLTVYDDGSGPALYAGGAFTTAAGVPAKRIARWDGTSWSALGGGVNGLVDALTVYDDGGGAALYVGGDFTAASGIAASRIAKWDGASWSALGSGINGSASALTEYDDGGGPALYTGGTFSSAGGVATNNVARWDGTSWSALGSGTNGAVSSLTVYDAGGGPALYAGGSFTTAGGVAASRIAKWDGASWSALGTGMSGGPGTSVQALTVLDAGGGPALYAGGSFTSAGGVAAKSIAKWDGSSWSPLDGGVTTGGGVHALAMYDDGGGPALFAGGQMMTVGAMTVDRIAKWDGASWSALGSGLDGEVEALTVYGDAGGSALYAGGFFTAAGGVTVNGIAKWDGSSWAILGGGILPNGAVQALTVFDDGSGPELFAGGGFSGAGGVPASCVARWDGTSWMPLGSGVNNNVYALTVFDRGSGPALYAGGQFTTAGGLAASRIAKWDGTSWSALGSGVSGGPLGTAVQALTVFDDGTGPALYAGGAFTSAGGVTANYIAKWDGTSWSALGSGMNSDVLALTVHDDGTGPALYAGGRFTSAGGLAARSVAKWDGTSWSPLGGGLGSGVSSFVVHDDGGGLELYAGTSSGNRVAKWDGSDWSGLDLLVDDNTSVLALASWDDGNGPALFAGGDFHVSRAGDSYLAKWGCRPKATVKRHKL